MAPKLPPVPGSSPVHVSPPAVVAAPVITMQGDIKVLHLKPPIVVRDFAVALSLKPFKLISELNQLVGFAAMNSTIDEAVAQKVAGKYGFLLEIKHRADPAVQQQQAKEMPVVLVAEEGHGPVLVVVVQVQLDQIILTLQLVVMVVLELHG